MKKIVFFIALVIVLLVIFCNSHKLIMIVENDRAKDLHEFTIIYSGKKIVIPIIKSGNSKSITLNPKGESSLEINFNIDGVIVSKKYDTYFEGGAIGNFDIKIFDDSILGYEETYPACIYKYIDSNSYKPLIEYREH